MVSVLSSLLANINAYHTEWKDKTMSKGIDVKDGDTFVDRFEPEHEWR